MPGQRPTKIERLQKVPLFAGLSKRDLNRLASEADEVQVDAGTVLTRQGGIAREFLLIVSGEARVERNGRRIARLRSGDGFGEMSLLSGEPRSATVTAEKPTTLLVLPSWAFKDLLDEVPGVARKLLVTMSQRLRDADEQLSNRN